MDHAKALERPIEVGHGSQDSVRMRWRGVDEWTECIKRFRLVNINLSPIVESIKSRPLDWFRKMKLGKICHIFALSLSQAY